MWYFKKTRKFFCSNNKNNKIFTISIIGRPNVGKSTLFNALAGKYVSLVDSIPGLTRDRKETIIEFLDSKVKIVDTAGINSFDDKYYSDIKNDIGKLTLFQSRNALLKSDLALFIIDGREGFTNEDKCLYKWLESNMKDLEIRGRNAQKINDYIDLRKDNYFDKENETPLEIEEEKEQIQQTKKDSEIIDEINESNFFKFIKSKNQVDAIYKLPKIIFIANKVEDDYIPKNLIDLPSYLNRPIYISAKKGDGMSDLYAIIDKHIPKEYKILLEERKSKRQERYMIYKTRLREEFINYIISHNKKQLELKSEEIANLDVLAKEKLLENEFVKYNLATWDKDFDFFNGNNIENNSDFDSDNDIDPLDNIAEKYKVAKEGSKNLTISENNFAKIKRPIKVAIVGQTNVGKSSIINSLLKENRVIVSDVPGTTRDIIPIEWLYKGKRIELIDTAGLESQPDNSIKFHRKKDFEDEKLEKLISEKTVSAIKTSQVIMYVFDSFKALEPFDYKLLNYIGREGRALVLVANKFDLIPNGYKIKAKSWISQQLEKHCLEFKNIKIIFTSVKSNFKIDSIMENVIKSYLNWNTRLPTKTLNQFNNQLNKVAKIPNRDGEYLNLKFIAQLKVRPPCFVLFVNNMDLFFKAHEEFIKKMISKEFNLFNVPLRFIVRDREVKAYRDGDLNYETFKKKSVAGTIIEKKVKIQKEKLRNITYLRKSKGYELLKGKFKPNSIRH